MIRQFIQVFTGYVLCAIVVVADEKGASMVITIPLALLAVGLFCSGALRLYAMMDNRDRW